MIRLILFTLCFLYPSDNYAYSSDWAKGNEISARVVVGGYTDDGIIAGIHFKLKKGWKTYWRMPGDGGLPLKIESKSSNVKDIEILWPFPKRIIAYETIETFGYKNEVVIPFRIILRDVTKPFNTDLLVKYAACDEICVFNSEVFKVNIEPEHSDPAITTILDKYLSRMPKKNGYSGLFVDSANISGNFLEVTVSSKEKPFAHPDVFIDASDNFRFPKADVSFSGDKALFKIPFEVLLSTETLKGKSALITFTNGNSAVEKEVSIESPTSGDSAASPEDESEFSMFYILIIAFIGGLILNIMPCVLPVLSLKLLGILRHGGGADKKHVRVSFFASAFGIIFSFILLACIVILLKSLGVAVGWGFHFQEPLFLIALIVILNLFAANQWGLFEITFSMGGRIHGRLDDSSAIGNFLAGVFVTILATPCSAPYLGTAIGFALSRGTFEILVTFFAMGIGLAFPYILFAFVPHLVTKLPKPGMWMVKVKHFMGYLLIATSLWLIWVVSNQISNLAAIIIATLSFFIIITLIFIKNKKVLRTLIAVLIALSFAPPFFVKSEQHIAVKEDIWIPFNETKIHTLVSEGKVVFVDVTADWCLTCKYNKMHVINDEMELYFKKHGVIAMKADYTSHHNDITEYLKSFNRYGIPFNVVYGKNAPEGITLSELLSKEEVITAIENAL